MSRLEEQVQQHALMIAELIRLAQQPVKEHDHTVLDSLEVTKRFKCPAGTDMYGSGATLYEFYTSGDDSAHPIYGANWGAQTFTPQQEGHLISSVKLKLYKTGSPGPGTVTVSIKSVDGSSEPTGSDLASGTYDGDTLGATPGALVEITFTTPYALTVGTEYAIVVRATSGLITKFVGWRNDVGDGTYSGGSMCVSTNSGSTWTVASGYDFMFEEYGTELNVGTEWIE